MCIMATKEKGKKSKDGEKRSAKKSEGSIVGDDKKEESFLNETETSPTEYMTLATPRKEPSPEPIYDEPTLSELIIERFWNIILTL